MEWVYDSTALALSSSDVSRVGDHTIRAADRTLASCHSGQQKSYSAESEESACRIQVRGVFGIVVEKYVQSIERRGARSRRGQGWTKELIWV